jgi:NADH:ubiquinone oxidoreductase subunit F (NADH-binding)
METTSDQDPVHEVSGADSAAPRPGPAVLQVGPARLTRGFDQEDRIGRAAHERLHGRPRPLGLGDLAALADAGSLCERDATAFPFARKLRAVADAAAFRTTRPVVVVDGTEREPGSAKDTMLLTRAPHLVLDGAVLAATALGAREIVVGVVDRMAADSIRRAIMERDMAATSRVVQVSESFLTEESGDLRDLHDPRSTNDKPGTHSVHEALAAHDIRDGRDGHGTHDMQGAQDAYDMRRVHDTRDARGVHDALGVRDGQDGGMHGAHDMQGARDVRGVRLGHGMRGAAGPAGAPRGGGGADRAGPDDVDGVYSVPGVHRRGPDGPGRARAESGGGDLPTLLSNAETLAQLAVLASIGVRDYRSVGIGAEPGTVLLTVTGSARYPAIVEIPSGAPLIHLLDLCGANAGDGVLVGGYHGAWLGRATATAAEVSRESMAAAGGVLGAGIIMPLGRRTCPLGECAAVARQLAADAARCTPCRPGLAEIAAALTALAAGRDGPAALRALRGAGRHVRDRSACHHLGGMARFAASALDVFAREVAEHLTRGTCGRPVLGLLPARRAAAATGRTIR